MTRNSHSFSIVQESDDSRSIFIVETIKRGISEGSAVILVSESSPNETLELLELNGLLDARNYTNRGLLTILDKDIAYSIEGTNLEAKRLLERWFSLISDVTKKSGCQRILVIGTPKVFFESNESEKLIVYERQIGKKFDDIPLEAVCCFNANSFSKLSFEDIIHILDYHEYVIYHNGVYVQWHPNMILKLINRAIDSVFGAGCAALLLKIMKVMYDYDISDLLVSQPGLFENKLQKLLGTTSNTVIDRIKKAITTELLYLHSSDRTATGPEQ